MKKLRQLSSQWMILVLILSFMLLGGCTEQSAQATSVSEKVTNEEMQESDQSVEVSNEIESLMLDTTLNGQESSKVNSIEEDGELKVSLTDIATIIGADSQAIYVPVNKINEYLDVMAIIEDNHLALMTKLPTRFTEAFSVEYLKNGLKKVIDGENRTLILAPKDAEIPEKYANEIIITTPLESLFLGSTTQGCLLRPIGEEVSVVGVTTDTDEWYIDGIKKRMETGNITYVGSSNAPDYELIAALEPQVAMVYTGPYGQVDLIEKFDELGITYVVDNDYLENHPFGRMEWMKFAAAFYDKEIHASKMFNEAVSNIENLSASLENKEKPKVAWASVYKGDVYVPGQESYVAKMIEMAGGDFVFDLEGTSSSKISLEDFYAGAADVDVLIYSSSKAWTPTIAGVVESAPALADIKAVQDMNVWCFHADYYQSIDKTDELILDLVSIFSGKGDVDHYEKYTE